MDKNTVPITIGFREDLNAMIGKAQFTDEGLAEIRQMIEMNAIPKFAVSFIGEPDENGVYHKAELMGLSMVFEKPCVPEKKGA